jgi:probable rRNA maturation factor
LGCPEAELSLLIVDDAGITPLNQEYLGRSGPTNVLAFPMQAGEYGDLNPHLLGDVVISVETCRREAEAVGMRFEQRFTELLIHGILHLRGYDHEQSPQEARRMARKSRDLLARLAAGGRSAPPSS